MLKHYLQRWLIILVALVGLVMPYGSVLAANLPKGWASNTVGELSFGLPSTWKNIELTKKALQTVANEVQPNNPELARILQNLIDSGQYQVLTFFAIEPATQQNLNLAVVPVGAQLRPKDLIDALATQIIQSLPNATLVEKRSDLVLNGIAAARITYDIPVTGTNGKTDTLRGFQYYIPIGTNIYIMSITGRSSKAFGSLVDQIASTVRLTDKTLPTEATAIVKSSGNLRAAPGTTAKVIATITAKEKLLVLGKNKAGTWMKVTTPRGKIGWASAKLLSIEPAVLKQLKVVT